MTTWWIIGVLSGAIPGWVIGVIMGIQRGRGMRDKMLRRRSRNEVAIEEAKLLYEYGQIDRADLETRVGHLHDWDGSP